MGAPPEVAGWGSFACGDSTRRRVDAKKPALISQDAGSCDNNHSIAEMILKIGFLYGAKLSSLARTLFTS